MPTSISRGVLAAGFLAMLAGLGGCATADQARSAPASGTTETQELTGELAEMELDCSQGQTEACGMLGLRYQEGQGVDKDKSRAAQLFEKACGGGDARGCSMLGLSYLHGSGVARDQRRGIQLLEKSCESHPLGCNLLAMAYRDGTVVPVDLQRAADLFKRACEAGDDEACQETVPAAPGFILILSGENMLPSYPDASMNRMWFETISLFSEELQGALTREGLSVQRFLIRDRSRSTREELVDQMTSRTYGALVQISIRHVKDASENAIYLHVSFNKLHVALDAAGQRGVRIGDGVDKEFPLLRMSGEDMREASFQDIAGQFVQELRAQGAF